MNATGRAARYPGVVTLLVRDLMVHERALVGHGELVVGLDEVGRGALAGPMTVGAVVVSSDAPPPEGLADSKLLSPAQRDALVAPLRAWASAWAVASVSAAEIDEWGLRLALAVAATRALDALAYRPTVALVDGSFNLLAAPHDGPFGGAPRLSYAAMPCHPLVRGDQRCATIAAASVLAKVHRDRTMVELHEEHPSYGWARNKGYGAPEHLSALRREGPTRWHRHSWRLPSPDGIGPFPPRAFGAKE